MPTPAIIRDLGGGLILRHGRPADSEPLALLNAEHLEGGGPAGDRLAVMTRDLFSRPHASLTPGHFTIVEDTTSGQIVSALCLIEQTWSYDGIEFGVGRPEYVVTHPDFRKRGLIRAQFEVIHHWCLERGLPVQGITGIPYFYRQFGYEYALDLGGRRFGSLVPKLKDGEVEHFTVRPAALGDIPLMQAAYDCGRRRSLVSVLWPAVHWHNNLAEMSAENIIRLVFGIIEQADTHQPVGYLAHDPHLGRSGINLAQYELLPGHSWLEVTPAVVRHLWRVGQEMAAQEKRACETFGFILGAQHPSYDALGNALPQVVDPYAWYLRVPDVLGFLKLIQPVLERRLAESAVCGHSGELLIGMYPKGVRLVLEQGRIAALAAWQPEHADHGHAGFPALTFLPILFGHRSYEELKYAFPDCWWNNDQTRLLINTLFPKRNSNVYGIA